jgi:hypothetical protein
LGLDGYYDYDPNLVASGDLGSYYSHLQDATRLDSQVDPALPQKLVVAAVSPGENNSFQPGVHPLVIQPRAGGGRYDSTWQGASSIAPDWVIATSWNEWYEATSIAPSDVDATTALDQTRFWSAAFKR